MVTASPRTNKPIHRLITPRIRELLRFVWEHRQLTRAQLELLCYAHLAKNAGVWESSLPGRDLRALVQDDFLIARPQPLERLNGRPPLVYSLGRSAIPVVSRVLELPQDLVLARQQQDAKLSWLFYDHRKAIADIRIRLTLAANELSGSFSWQADEDLARLKLTVAHDGKRLPVRPDAFFVLDVNGHRFPRFLEVQLTSRPAAFLRKAIAYDRFSRSELYPKTFGFRSMRVLAVTDTQAKASHLVKAVAALESSYLFFAATLDQATTTPLGAIWTTPDKTNPVTLQE